LPAPRSSSTVRITSTDNAAVKAARRLGRSHQARADGAFLVEGPNAIAAAGQRLLRLFATPRAMTAEADLLAVGRRAGAEIVEVSEDVLAAIATTVTPQGIVGVASLERPSLQPALAGARLVLVLVEVADPGNVGTVIRTADALGADAVVLSAGSADARNPKAVRSSAGSLFSLPVVEGDTIDDILAACRASGLRTVATSPRAPTDADRADLSEPIALVFGNEAHGLAAEVLRRCDADVRVPLDGRAESLNLAAAVAILTYEAARQRRHAGTDAP
jgi:RNA methyltransferase, TrmH family